MSTSLLGTVHSQNTRRSCTENSYFDLGKGMESVTAPMEALLPHSFGDSCILASQDQTPCEKRHILCATLEERTAIGVCNGGVTKRVISKENWKPPAYCKQNRETEWFGSRRCKSNYTFSSVQFSSFSSVASVVFSLL